MAGYRPLGLSSAPGSTIIAGRATSYADRRRAAAERLSRTADIAQRLEAAVAVPDAADPATSSIPIDPDGTLRASIRALLPLAYRMRDFDVTVSVGPQHVWAARLQHGPAGVTAELVPGHGRPAGEPQPIGFGGPDQPEAAEVASQLAALLWSGEVGAR